MTWSENFVSNIIAIFPGRVQVGHSMDGAPDGGLLLVEIMKQISQEDGKQKFYNPYNYATFRYGGFIRVGYGAFGVFAKYYVNNMFQDSPEQDGLKNFSFGVMVGF
jgi:hypothetical protein